MVKGVTRRVVVVRAPDQKYFEQAIFLLREEAESPDPPEEQVLKQAQAVADAYLLRTSPGPGGGGPGCPPWPPWQGAQGPPCSGGWAAAVSPFPFEPASGILRRTPYRQTRSVAMDNIILIGMPGVGKSTLGVLLAKTLGMTFLDTDLVIQEQEGALLRDLIADRGIEGFLDLEGEVCAHLQAHRTVVATGGSVVYRSQAMAHLRELGTVVYLKLGYRALAKRLGSLKRRGVVLRPGQTLRMLYEERVPLYEQYAHLTIDCSGQDVEHTLDRVMRALEKRGQG